MTLLGEEQRALAAHGNSVRLETPAVAKYLQELLGTRVLAVITGSRDPKALASWIEGTRQPRPKVEQRLRAALQTVEILMDVETGHVVRAWFIGINPQLEDETPADALAADRLKDVVSAARAFVRAG